MFSIKLRSLFLSFIWGALQLLLKVFNIFFFLKNMIFTHFIISKILKIQNLASYFLPGKQD